MTTPPNLQSGDLRTALQELQNEVRQDPANARHRIYLFQLLSVLGDWSRARDQLKVAGDLESDVATMVQAYQGSIDCEDERNRMFETGAPAPVFGEPEPWMAQLLEAHRLTASGSLEASQRLRTQALEQAPASSGRIRFATPEGDREATFLWFADADTRLGPMLECVVNGRYFWIPFTRIRRISIDPPTDLRDLVWTPARFTWSNDGEAVGMIPTRYAGSTASEDGKIRMAARTEWADRGHDVYFGLGQRLFTTDAEDYPLLDVREVEFDPTGDEALESRALDGQFDE